MYLSRKQLENFIDLTDYDNEVINQTLNNLGWETEIKFDYQKFSQKLQVVEIIKITSHPIMTKNFICQAKSFDNNKIEIICGADNFKINDKVILAGIGTVMPDGMKMKKRKFHDIYSYGMFCSWDELNLSWKTKNPNGIAILPKNTSLGYDALNKLSLNDCLFKIDIPWNQPELQSIWVIAKYLSKVWNQPLKTNLNPEILFNLTKLNHGLQNKITKLPEKIFPKNNVEPWLIACITISKNANSIKSEWDDLLNLHQLPQKTTWLEQFQQFQTLKWGTDLKFIPLQENNSDLQERKYFIILDSEATNKKQIPTYLFIMNYLDCLMQLTKNNYIKLEHHWINPKLKLSTQKLTVKKQFIEKIIGMSFIEKKLIELFANFDYKLTFNQDETITFELPKFHYFKNENEIISDLMRFLSVEKLPIPKLKITEINWKGNLWISWLEKIANYLLQIGIYQTKNYTLISKRSEDIDKAILIVHQKERQQLQNSILFNLFEIQKKLKKHVFTIDKTFHMIDKNYHETTHLGIVLKKTLIEESWTQGKITYHRKWLLELLRNICILTDLKSEKLFKLQTNLKAKPIFDNQGNSGEFGFNNQGYDEIFYEQTQIGKIGISTKYQKQKWIEQFFIELDLTQMFQLIKKQSSKFLHKTIDFDQKSLIFQDFTIKLNQPGKTKIYCQYEKQIFQCDHWNHLIKSFYAADKKIYDVKLLNRYQDHTFTFRLYKQLNPDNLMHQEELFVKIKKVISTWKHAKIT